MRKPWSLYNKEDKLRVDDLTSEQVRVVLLATATKRMHHWYACQEGDLHWQPITSIPEFYEDVREIKGPQDETSEVPSIENASGSENKSHQTPAVSDPVERRPLFEDGPSDLRTDPALQVDTARIQERRAARRYPRKLDFRTEVGGQDFSCETVDISMSGLSLAQDLPSWIPRTFQADISLGKKSVKVHCSRVTGRKLKIREASSWDVIRAWIVNW